MVPISSSEPIQLLFTNLIPALATLFDIYVFPVPGIVYETVTHGVLP